MSGGFIVSAAEIAGKMGAGWNYGNTLEANFGGTPDETVWGNPKASQAMVDAVADAGFRTIRIPVSFLSKIDDSNGFRVDREWLDRIAEVVDYCYNRDLFVIINIHGDGYHTIKGGWLLCDSTDQNYIKEKYGAVWRQIALRFADYDEHLIFESMNEVFDGIYHTPVAEYYENINDYNQIFVDTVRSTGGNNTHRWLMTAGWNTDINYTCGGYGFRFPEDSGNTCAEGRLILSVHCYDPWDYCGEEKKTVFLWGEKGQEIVDLESADPCCKADWGDEAHIRAQFEMLKRMYVDMGIPVVIGEFGCIDRADSAPHIPERINENRAYYDGFVAGTAAQNGLTPVYWDNGFNGKFGLGLFDRRALKPTQPEIIEAIISGVRNKDPMAGISACTRKCI
ncbi:glycoside hydrolase family 5 protein [uncultured Ruminococcus sp.]|uniref:glycoside hydrolase family 5 protein n=1 Tax=uncultured Ruminococcus sp. TaxID=165186 RepID=UPI002632E1E9|nr:glycoside hydrolase family 5 protein [uncultured Ruminococcus sp.]